MATQLSFGISLGTDTCMVATHSSAAPGRVDVAANESGDRGTPACVAFVNGETLVGDSAKGAFVRQPTQTVTNVVQLLNAALVNDGKVMTKCELEVKEDAKRGGEVVTMPNADPENEAGHDAPDVATTLLKGIKAQVVDGALGTSEMASVVVSAPRYLDFGLVESLVESAGLAASKVRVIGNDIAAAYGALPRRGEGASADPLGTPADAPRCVLVLDWGHNACSASIIQISGGAAEHVAEETVFNCGGKLVDKEITKMCAQTFQRKTKMDPTDNGRSMRKLEAAARQAKHTLTASLMAPVELEAFCEGVDLRDNISRMKVEMGIRETKIMDRAFETCKAALAKAVETASARKATLPELSDVVLSGGTCRIPVVAKTLQAWFARDFASASVHAPTSADEISACGAALQAATMAIAVSEEDISNGSASVPALAHDVAIVIGKLEAKMAPEQVHVVARIGTPLPALIPLEFAAKGARGLRLAVGLKSEGDHAFGPLPGAMKVPGEEELKAELRIAKGPHGGLEAALVDADTKVTLPDCRIAFDC